MAKSLKIARLSLSGNPKLKSPKPAHHFSIHNDRKNRGYSLLELLISSSLSIFVLAGLFQILTGIQNTQKVDIALSEIQNNGQHAIKVLKETLRYRGFFGCLKPVTLNFTEENKVNWEQARYAENLVSTQDYFQNLSQTSLRGYEVQADGKWKPEPSSDDEDIKNLITITGQTNATPTLRKGSDILSIQYTSTDSLSVAKEMDSPFSPLILEDGDLSIEKGDIVFIGDCEDGSVFEISQIDNSTDVVGAIEVSHNVSVNSSETFNQGKKYGTDAQLRKFNVDTFFVGDTGRLSSSGETIFSLYKRDIKGDITEVIEGIEHLQVQYGQILENGNSQYFTADNSGLDMRKVSSIELGLLVSSTSRTLDTLNTANYDLPGVTLSPASQSNSTSTASTHQAGHLMKKVYRTRIELKNKS